MMQQRSQDGHGPDAQPTLREHIRGLDFNSGIAINSITFLFLKSWEWEAPWRPFIT